ncbi:hypothetical protein FJZ18_04395 [Candidatus Pacearchaeota archaeon]|nr:hypothetical protein [Candidatus Pacearchaeota archaeon]
MAEKTTDLNSDELLKFILKAHRNTYAALKEVRQKNRFDIPILPGHKDYDFAEGKWRYHDSYSGRLWAPGREVIFLDEKPVWCMSYQGMPCKFSPECKNNQSSEARILPMEFYDENVFPFLKRALMRADESMPFRGPPRFNEEEFEYGFEMQGNYEYFTGRESVVYFGREVFFQNVMGSIIR